MRTKIPMNKKQNHIALVTNTAWSMFNFRNNLIKNLIRKNIKVTIIAPEDEYSEKLREMGCETIEICISAKGKNPKDEVKLLHSLFKIYKKIKPDFIIHYTIKPNIYGSISAHLANIPCISITTGLGYTFTKNNYVSRIARKLYQLAFRFPQEVWFLNEDDRKTFLSYELVKKENAVLLYSEGVDLQHFAPHPKPQPDDKIRFLLIARMLWDKGIGEYIEAARIVRRQYPHAVFQLLGACGVPNPSVIGREQIATWEQEGVIEYLGTTDDVRPLIAQADCIVLPSFYREGIPRTLMEAAAMAKPLITTDNVGCRDVVRDGETGFMCPVKDAQALVACCIRMLELPAAEREAIGQAGRSFMAEVFDEQKVIAQYMATLQKYGVLPAIHSTAEASIQH